MTDLDDENLQYKIVYFNRRETESDCDKIEYENEIFALRNMFESKPNDYLFTISYYAPNENEQYGLYEHNITAKNRQEAEKKFKALDFVKDTDHRLRIKSIVFQEEVMKTW